MKFYEFGEREKPVILLLPGTSCHWKLNFEKHIPLLQESFYVVAVSYDGFDETEETIFPDMLTETKKIEEYIQSQFDGKICAAYGCSLGGSFVSLLVGRKNIHIDHAIIGSSDMDQAGPVLAKFETFIIGKILPQIICDGKIPKFLQNKINKAPEEKRKYMNTLMAVFTGDGKGMPFVKKESICNQFYSDLVTEVGDEIETPGTIIHVFYATKMGKEYEKKYLKHFKQPDICRQDYEHEEFFFVHPKEWYEEVKKVCLCN
ncbi:MAG: alpha/beta hydrolase [Lachnospiraceae bacterium]|nr:alpha/beta hydrolase [Lachnospiraceae bacterium]